MHPHPNLPPLKGEGKEGEWWVPSVFTEVGTPRERCGWERVGGGMGFRIREDNGWGRGMEDGGLGGVAGGGWDGFPHPSSREQRGAARKCLVGQGVRRNNGWRDGSPHPRGQGRGVGSPTLHGGELSVGGHGRVHPHPNLPPLKGEGKEGEGWVPSVFTEVGTPRERCGSERVGGGMGFRIRFHGGRLSAGGRGWVPASARTRGGGWVPASVFTGAGSSGEQRRWGRGFPHPSSWGQVLRGGTGVGSRIREDNGWGRGRKDGG